MSFELDEVTLAAMTQEARQCFLDEDAPNYLQILENEIKQGCQQADFTQILRASHSLKGGAGIADIHSVRALAHYLEDVIDVIQKQPNCDDQRGWKLLEWTVNEVALLLYQARTIQVVTADPKLLNALADFVTSPSEQGEQLNQTESLTPSTVAPTVENHQSIDPQAQVQLRIPLERLESMTNHVEELLVTRERLRSRQQQLAQVTRKIRQISRQLEPIQDQIQTFYNQLAINPISVSSATNQDFDALEMDRYTELHSSLQTFQELMLQFQENYADLTLINQDFSDNLDTVDTNLDSLYTQVTESRLVPFEVVAKRFFPQIQSLNRRYDKLVDFSIEGEDTLIDQLLLEQLQTPLTHLINNAFDHGIESPSERLVHQKSAQAKILLKASIKNHQLEIILSDDGRGIDLYKVYQRAKNKQLISPKVTFDQLSQKAILDLIFQPNFSTVETVGELSGRGVGLDIVRSKLQKLRGKIEVTNEPGQGTKFILTIPLNLSFISLFLVQWQHHLFAIPTASVLETIPSSEIVWLKAECPTVKWRDQSIPVHDLSCLLSTQNNSKHSNKSQVGLVLESSSTPIMVMVDNLISEEQLIVKPFDDTVFVPNYLVGCTILGGGEIVPVILPQAFTVSFPVKPVAETSNHASAKAKKYGTILIAEDSVATRRLLERILEQMGFNVIACRDGQEALEKLQFHQEGIDLIISDIEMPKVNGFELLEKVRSHPHWAHIPVVMATSRTGQRHRQQGMELGANAYLGKPILPKVLLNTIKPLIRVE